MAGRLGRQPLLVLCLLRLAAATTPAPVAVDAADDDDTNTTSDRIYYSIVLACALCVAITTVFDRLRSRVWWVYEPKCHHLAYKDHTPPAPGPRFLAWIRSVLLLWGDEDVLRYAGLDGLCLCYFLRFAMDQSLFAGVAGLVVLVPAYHSGRGLHSGANVLDDDPPEPFSFSMTTVQNIRCRLSHSLLDKEYADAPLFPPCQNGFSNWRFALIVCCAWVFTLRALSRISSVCQRFVHLRHWHLTRGLDKAGKAAPENAQHALTAVFENVPHALRSSRALKRKLDRLLGDDAVAGTQIMVGGLDELDGLVARRDRAREALEDARSKRAKLASMRAARLRDEAERAKRVGRPSLLKQRSTLRWFEGLLGGDGDAADEEAPKAQAMRRAHSRDDAHDTVKAVEANALKALADLADAFRAAKSSRHLLKRRDSATFPVPRHVNLPLLEHVECPFFLRPFFRRRAVP